MTEDGVGDIAGLVGGGIVIFMTLLVALLLAFIPGVVQGEGTGGEEVWVCCCCCCIISGMAGTIVPFGPGTIMAGYMGIVCGPFGV